MARSAEVGFSPFFCLSHSRDFRYGPHNPLDLTCAGLARAVKIEVAREGTRHAPSVHGGWKRDYGLKSPSAV